MIYYLLKILCCLSLYLKSWSLEGLSSVLVINGALDQVLVQSWYWYWPLERRPGSVSDSLGPGH